jgi:hypothetical protein
MKKQEEYEEEGSEEERQRNLELKYCPASLWTPFNEHCGTLE